MNRSKLLPPDTIEGKLNPSRRRFLKQLGGFSLLAFSSCNNTSLASRIVHNSAKTIALNNINTGDKLKLTYFEHGRYIEDALQEISFLFRDFRSGDIHHVDPLLIDQLYHVKQILEIDKAFEVICGYRSPNTNASLHKQNHRVAEHSLHMEGRAIDIRISGLETLNLRNAAMSIRSGGVGYYPRENFVHLDTGNIRTW